MMVRDQVPVGYRLWNKIDSLETNQLDFRLIFFNIGGSKIELDYIVS